MTPSAEHAKFSARVKCASRNTLLLDSFLKRSEAAITKWSFRTWGLSARVLPSASFLRAFAGSGVVKNQGQVRGGHATDAACSSSDRIGSWTQRSCPLAARTFPNCTRHVDSRAAVAKAIRTNSSHISELACKVACRLKLSPTPPEGSNPSLSADRPESLSLLQTAALSALPTGCPKSSSPIASIALTVCCSRRPTCP